METNLKRAIVMVFATVFVYGCSKDSINTSQANLNSSGSIMEPADFEISDLVGIWKMMTMESNVAVDLDYNQTSTKIFYRKPSVSMPCFSLLLPMEK